MILRAWVAVKFVAICMLGASVSAWAQSGCGAKDRTAKAACLIPNIFAGIAPASTSHIASFPSAEDFAPTLTDLTTGFLNQLTSLPLPSPASGATYTFTTAGPTVVQQSFGPILSERAETIGRHHANAGFSFQRFTFQSVDGNNLHQLPAVFPHGPLDAGTKDRSLLLQDVVTTNNNIDLSINQFTAFGTYGLTNRVDLSVALPISEVHVGISSAAKIERIGTASLDAQMGGHVHSFPNTPEPQNRDVFGGSKNTSGIGDITARLKWSAIRFGENEGGFSFATDIRFPTGDAYDLLGSGAIGIKPFVAFSYNYKRITPHFNFGYLWNGSSVLAGDLRTGRKGHIPNQFPYAVGFDVGVARRLTVDFDVIGQELINAKRVARQSFTASNGATFADLTAIRDSVNITNGSVGFKFNPVGKLLLTFNLMFKMNDGGLRDKLTPLFGISFSR